MNRSRIKDDILIISYYFMKNGWVSANKVSYQRVLYFAAVLSPIFVTEEEWQYEFSNTLFGPYNNEISRCLQELYVKGDLNLVKRNIYQNRIEESFKISQLGTNKCLKIIMCLKRNELKNKWFEIIVKTLSLYGDKFISKLVKEDPNVVNMNQMNNTGKFISNNSSSNLSKEFFNYIKEAGVKSFNIYDNEDILLMYFDILFRKYNGAE